MAGTHLDVQILVGLRLDFSGIVHTCASDILQRYLLLKESQSTCLTWRIFFSVQRVVHVK